MTAEKSKSIKGLLIVVAALALASFAGVNAVGAFDEYAGNDWEWSEEFNGQRYNKKILLWHR